MTTMNIMQAYRTSVGTFWDLETAMMDENRPMTTYRSRRKALEQELPEAVYILCADVPNRTGRITPTHFELTITKVQ